MQRFDQTGNIIEQGTEDDASQAERIGGGLHRMQSQNRIVLGLREPVATGETVGVRIRGHALRLGDNRIAVLVRDEHIQQRCSSATNTYSSGASAIYGCLPISDMRFLSAGSLTRTADQSFRYWLEAACWATVSSVATVSSSKGSATNLRMDLRLSSVSIVLLVTMLSLSQRDAPRATHLR